MLTFVCITAILVSVAIADDDTWKQNIEYFEQVHLDCAKYNKDGTILSVAGWILPNGDVIRSSNPVDDKHVHITDNGFSLKIDRLDDDDFGIYYCIVDKGTNDTDVIKIGINVDGPYFGSGMKEEFIHDAKIGGITAGCTVVLLLFVWLVCGHVSRQKSKLYHQQQMAKHLTDVDAQSKSGDDSVYYIADGISPPTTSPDKTNTEEQCQVDVNTDERYYHSIGSIEKMKSKDNKGFDKMENTAL